jgi:hypothetical protein
LEQFERDFELQLDALARDSQQAARFAYTQAAFDYRAAEFEIMDRLNQHAAFWNGVLGALQTSAFIALGRIFDDDKTTHNADDLLRYAEDYRGIFSKGALAARKMRAGLSSEDAKEYASDCYELRPGGLAPLRAEFAKRRALYKDKVAPIRHKVFAHAGKLNREQRDALFTSLFKRSLEDLVVFTLRLERALWQLYHNGIEPSLADAPSNIGDVMKALPATGVATWEHLHAAKETQAFMDWLRRGPLDED